MRDFGGKRAAKRFGTRLAIREIPGDCRTRMKRKDDPNHETPSSPLPSRHSDGRLCCAVAAAADGAAAAGVSGARAAGNRPAAFARVPAMAPQMRGYVSFGLFWQSREPVSGDLDVATGKSAFAGAAAAGVISTAVSPGRFDVCKS
jgi:hypothetical protein